LEKTDSIPDDVYELVLKLTNPIPSNRPNLSQIIENWSDLKLKYSNLTTTTKTTITATTEKSNNSGKNENDQYILSPLSAENSEGMENQYAQTPVIPETTKNQYERPKMNTNQINK
jgi:hypothetical protein